jgi:hypothetical protein
VALRVEARVIHWRACIRAGEAPKGRSKFAQTSNVVAAASKYRLLHNIKGVETGRRLSKTIPDNTRLLWPLPWHWPRPALARSAAFLRFARSMRASRCGRQEASKATSIGAAIGCVKGMASKEKRLQIRDDQTFPEVETPFPHMHVLPAKALCFVWGQSIRLARGKDLIIRSCLAECLFRAALECGGRPPASASGRYTPPARACPRGHDDRVLGRMQARARHTQVRRRKR